MIMKGRLAALVAIREAIGPLGAKESAMATLELNDAGRAEYKATLIDFSRTLGREIGDVSLQLSTRGVDVRELLVAATKLGDAPAPATDVRLVVALLTEIRDRMVDISAASAAMAIVNNTAAKPHSPRKRTEAEPAEEPKLTKIHGTWVDPLPLDAYGACAFRKALGIPLAAICEQMGRDPSTVSTMENMIRLGKSPRAAAVASYRKAILKLADRKALAALARNRDEVVSTWGPLDGISARQRLKGLTTGKEATQ